MMNIPPQFSVSLAALYHHVDATGIGSSSPSNVNTRKRQRRSRVQSICIFDVLPAAVLYLLPPHSVAGLLRPCVKILRQWPKLLSKSAVAKLPQWMSGSAGPFGYGCGKLCEVICAYILLSVKYQFQQSGSILLWSPPKAFDLGPIPGRNSILLVLFLSFGVNIVLSLWSRMAKSKGNHSGVNKMVRDSIGRQISIAEHMQLAALAFGNAVCEEVVSRGFFYHEFVQSAQMTKDVANIAQAAAFGVWHYNGIPSGLAGVGLTFVYGLIMGILREHGGGLLLPILAHTIADYFIFSVIVREEGEIKWYGEEGPIHIHKQARS